MDDLISRQDVLHELDGCDYELKDWQRWKLKTMVRDIPSADPKEQWFPTLTVSKEELEKIVAGEVKEVAIVTGALKVRFMN